MKAEQSAEAVEIQKAIALANSRVRAGDDLDDYMCPLTLGLFVDPVLDSLGHTYERKAIDDWLNGHTTSPKTNEELPDKLLRPNRVMSSAMGYDTNSSTKTMCVWIKELPCIVFLYADV